MTAYKIKYRIEIFYRLLVKFTLSKDPKISFFCNSARIPKISLGSAVQSTYQGFGYSGDRLTYGDFSLRFLVDENLSIWQFIIG